MIKLYFIRHGETEWNITGRYQGSADVSLSEKGRAQAADTTECFRPVHLDGIFSSNLVRAADTARGIADTHHMPVKINPELRELDFGKWEGLTFTEIEKRWPGALDTMYDSPSKLIIEGGETFPHMQVRAMHAIRQIIALGDGKTYAIVSHGGTIRTIICGLLDLPLDKAWDFRQANANISCIEYYGGRNWLSLLNSTSHLHE